MPDAVVVGAGPNGLAAAATLARAGVHVAVYEANATVGGGARTDELTLPGFRHDICSAVHPLGVGSPIFRSLPLEQHGLEWVHPDVPLAHPLPDGTAIVLSRSIDETVASLEAVDARRYRRMVAPFAERWDDLAAGVLGAFSGGIPRDPLLVARFGVRALLPIDVLVRRFGGKRAPMLLAGMAGHAITPLSSPFTSGVALLFAAAGHAVGWPFPRGGAQSLSDALASYVRSLGGEVRTGARIESVRDLPAADAYLFDTTPEAFAAIVGARLRRRETRALSRYRHGPAAFKVDYALDGPVPWAAQDCHRAGTVHVGASLDEIRAALHAVHRGAAPDRPLLLTAQQSRFDPTRSPDGSHTFWVYGHVPFGWTGDLTDAIEQQLERFAPGFRDRVLARAVTGPPGMEAKNANLVGGDISNGRMLGVQTVVRPWKKLVPYRAADPALFLCSAATPPGPGVHGMSGYNAAQAALRSLRARP